MDNLEAFILAGGGSRRMGSDKSQLLLDGETLVQRVAAVLAKIAGAVTIVGGREIGQQFKSVEDLYPQWGALGGVHAALSACSTEWALIVACDMPFVTAEFFNRLSGFCHDFDAVAPIQPDGRPQPLSSLYRANPCRSVAEKLIQSGERRPITLLQSVRTRWVNFEELNDLPDAARIFDNMNTPEDYLRAQSKGASQTKD